MACALQINVKTGRSKQMKRILMLLTALLIAGTAYAQYFDPSYSSPFEAGYAAGYQRGIADRQYGRSQDLMFDSQYRLGNRSFRLGFQRGYYDGYHRGYARNQNYYEYGSPRYRGNSPYGYGQRSPYGYGQRSPYGYGQRSPYGYGGHNTPNTPYGAMRGAVTAFDDESFRGRAINLEVGSYPYLEGGWDDRIDSILVSPGVRVILFDERNFRGRRVVVSGNSHDLDSFGFGDKAASMIIEPGGSSRYGYDYNYNY
jgi:hypothetical protein